MDDNIAQFTSITNCDPGKAQRYLMIAENDLEHALQLFFEGGIDVDAPEPSTAPSDSRNTATGTRPESPIPIDDDDDWKAALEAAEGGDAYEDDEAVARRLQQQFDTQTRRNADDVRAPMARTTETLVGPDDLYTGGFGGARRGVGKISYYLKDRSC